jgi:UDP-glucose 4-epimerase
MTLRGKKVLVTGGAGFIGSHLCRRLMDEGADLHIAVKYNSLIDNIRLAAIWDRATIVEADLRNTDSLKHVASIAPEIVFHLAAYNHVGDSFLHVSEAIDSNAKASVNLLEAYEGYERFVYIATSEVYGHQEKVPFREDAQPFPLSPYAVGKYAGELYARLHWKSKHRPIVILRPFNAYGPYQSPRAIIAELILKSLRGEPLLTTKGEQTRDFNFVTNLVDGMILAATSPGIEGEVINVGSGVEVTIRDLVTLIHRITESKSDLKIGALEYRPGEIWRMFAENTKARTLLGWSPRINLEAGLKLTVDWYRRYLAELAEADSPVALLGA